MQARIKLQILEYENRTRQKFNKTTAAKELGMWPQHFSAIVSGKSYTTIPKTFQLAKMLGCKVDDLYKLEEDEA